MEIYARDHQLKALWNALYHRLGRPPTGREFYGYIFGDKEARDAIWGPDPEVEKEESDDHSNG